MKLNKLMLFIILLLLSGCATVLNPFQSEFKCSEVFEGECIPLDEAYELSIKDGSGSEAIRSGEDKGSPGNTKDSGRDGRSTAEEVYREGIYRTVGELLAEPEKPVVVPPKVVRILILPYKDQGNNLFMQRYLYFFATDPQWIFDVKESDDP